MKLLRKRKLRNRLNNRAKRHLSGSEKKKMMMRLREKAAATVRIIITVIVAIIEDGIGLLGATIAEVTQTANPVHL